MEVGKGFSRRHALLGATIGAGATALGRPGSVLAKAAMIGEPAPRWYRFRLGDAEATVVTDGTLPLGDPHANFVGLSADEMDRQLADNFLPLTGAVLEQNALVLNTGDRLILFDTGMGPHKLFGPTTGKLLGTLRQAGIDPSEIDAVVMSHAHIDHCAGCMSSDGNRHFPNAQYYISQADYEFWTDHKNVPAAFSSFVDVARSNLLPNRDRLVFFKDGEEFLPGVQAISAPGHTVGHTIFMIGSAGKQLCYAADLAHHPVLMFEKPLTEFAYDTDPKQSARTRQRLLTRFAEDRTAILAYHFPWPGIGHVARQGDGFRYIPEPMRSDL